MENDFITIVSGLPRSGTSLMMQMLAAGGLPPLTDELRPPDENNPRGYLEFEGVKKLRTDQTWLPQARGHAVKIIHLLLRELPVDRRFQYRVLFVRRPLEEVIASQGAMLARAGKTSADPAVLSTIYQSQLTQVEHWLAVQACFETRSFDYHRILKEPLAVAQEVASFLARDLDVVAMAEAIDPSLYRQRVTRGS
jgi:hypothetical protein